MMTDRELTIKIAETVGDLNLLLRQASEAGLTIDLTVIKRIPRVNFEVKRNGKNVAV